MFGERGIVLCLFNLHYFGTTCHTVYLPDMECFLCSVLFCDIILLCVTVFGTTCHTVYLPDMECFLCSVLFCDIILLCVTVFLLLIVLVLHCVCL
jgi:hypothetical protein